MTPRLAAAVFATAVCLILTGCKLGEGHMNLRGVYPDRTHARVYERVTVLIDMDASFDNPYDSSDITVDARIVSPSGIVTPYGDSGHHEHMFSWTAVFEKAAAQTGHGQWKQTAWDIFRFWQRQNPERMLASFARTSKANLIRGRGGLSQVLGNLSWLAMAALWSDPKLRRRARTDLTGVNARVRVGIRPKPTARRLPDEHMVPCQVAMTGGPTEPDAQTYLLLSVGPKLPHDHADAGAILMFSRGDRLLLGTNGYLQRELPYHNTFHVQGRRLKRFPDAAPGRMQPGDPECAGQIESLVLGQRTSRCRMSFATYHGHPLSLEREVVIEPTGAVPVLDRAVAQADGLCASPVFHGEQVRAIGPNAYRLRLATLRSMNGMEWRNPRGHLVVEFLHPDPRARVTPLGLPGVYRQQANYRQFPCVHYAKAWQASYTARQCLAAPVPLEKGRETLFVTRLVPHTR